MTGGRGIGRLDSFTSKTDGWSGVPGGKPGGWVCAGRGRGVRWAWRSASGFQRLLCGGCTPHKHRDMAMGELGRGEATVGAEYGLGGPGVVIRLLCGGGGGGCCCILYKQH